MGAQSSPLETRGGSQGPGHGRPGGCSGLPSRGRDPGRQRHPAASPLDGATNLAWSRRRARAALPSAPSPGCCVSRWPGCSEGGPRQRPALFPHLRPLCRRDSAGSPRYAGLTLLAGAQRGCRGVESVLCHVGVGFSWRSTSLFRPQ